MKADGHIESLPGMEDIGYQFKNQSILLEALTHASYSSENALPYDNQRMEFLGDSVIQMVVTAYLYAKYPGTDEGKLTKMRSFLTQKSTLALFAGHVNMDKFVRMGRGEIKSDGNRRSSTLCDSFEALCGAICLDGGLSSAERFIIPLLEFFYPSPEELLSGFNPKGYIQELTQASGSGTPEYRIDNCEGPDHMRKFTVSLWIGGEKVASGTASSRKAAESRAAEEAIRILRKESSKAPEKIETEKTKNPSGKDGQCI